MAARREYSWRKKKEKTSEDEKKNYDYAVNSIYKAPQFPTHRRQTATLSPFASNSLWLSFTVHTPPRYFADNLTPPQSHL